MKRLWLGVGLLLALLALGIVTTVTMGRICEPVGQTLTRAGEAARVGELGQAEALCRQAKTRWEAYRTLSAAVTDHAPMEEIDGMFAALSVCRDSDRYAEYCARLTAMVAAVAEAQAVNWWNIF